MQKNMHLTRSSRQRECCPAGHTACRLRHATPSAYNEFFAGSMACIATFSLIPLPPT